VTRLKRRIVNIVWNQEALGFVQNTNTLCEQTEQTKERFSTLKWVVRIITTVLENFKPGHG
jgi:hypothetical protein